MTRPRVHSLETGSQESALAWFPASLFSVLFRFLDNTKARRAARHPALQGQQADANSKSYFPQRLSSSQRLMETPALLEEGGPGPGMETMYLSGQSSVLGPPEGGAQASTRIADFGGGDKRLQKLGPLTSNVESVAPKRPGVHKLHRERKLCSAPHITKA